MTRLALAAYQTYFVDMQFERAGLFEAVRDRFDCVTVLYPGCFVHITPSLYFPHVVYVDVKEEANQFFAAQEDILEYIRRNKHYPRRPYLRFIFQDYTHPLPLPENSFDLLIALYAGGISQGCTRYLRPGGLLLTNNHQDDAGEAAANPELTLIAAIYEKGKTFTLSEDGLAEYFISKDRPERSQAYLQSTGRRVDYTRAADAYLFQKHSRK